MGIDQIRALKNSPKKEKPKGISKRSDKMKATIADLKKLYPIYLAAHPVCMIQGPNCTGKATCAHHSEGRLPSKIKDTTKWVPSCAPCNLWCETNDAEARLKGFKKSKF